MKKYLTVLIGHPRGGEKTWHSLYENVVEPLNSDLAILTGKKWIHDQSFVHKSKYLWVFDEPDDWFSYYEEKFTGNWKKYFELGKDTGLYNSGSIHFALKNILLDDYINDLKEYEQIIFTRFDQFYLNKHSEFSKDFIWIPEGEDYFGLCDRHAVVPNKYIEQYLDIVSFIDGSESLKFDDELLNCEVTYKNHLASANLIEKVNRFKRTQFTVSIDGDKNNWRIPVYKINYFNGIYLKYPDEFIASFKNITKFEKFKITLSKNFRLLTYYYYLEIRRKLGKVKKIFVKK